MVLKMFLTWFHFFSWNACIFGHSGAIKEDDSEDDSEIVSGLFLGCFFVVLGCFFVFRDGQLRNDDSALCFVGCLGY